MKFLLILIILVYSFSTEAEESIFSVNVTLLECAKLNMQDIDIENINHSFFSENDYYVSQNSGLLIASCNSKNGYIVKINAINQTDIVHDAGWKMTNISNYDKLEFYLLASQDDFGNDTPITLTGIVSNLPNEGTALTEDSLLINCTMKDPKEKSVNIHACIREGQIYRASHGCYTTTLKITLIVND